MINSHLLYQLSYCGINLAEKTGLEPATSCVTGRHSNQLSYFSVILVEVVGLEPTTFLMWRIYSPLPSTNSAHTSIEIIIHSPAMPVN